MIYLKYYEVLKIWQGLIIQDFESKDYFKFNSDFNKETVKSTNIGEIFSLFVVPVSTLAAAFWINWGAFKGVFQATWKYWITTVQPRCNKCKLAFQHISDTVMGHGNVISSI